MTKEAYEKIAAGLEDVIAFVDGDRTRGKIVRVADKMPDVAAIRRRLGLTQTAFAERYGLPVATVRNWEQGRTRPDPAGIGYLRVIDHAPDMVATALNGG